MNKILYKIPDADIEKIIRTFLDCIELYEKDNDFGLYVKRNLFGKIVGPHKKRFFELKESLERSLSLARESLGNNNKTDALINFISIRNEHYSNLPVLTPLPDICETFKMFLNGVGIYTEENINKHVKKLNEISKILEEKYK